MDTMISRYFIPISMGYLYGIFLLDFIPQNSMDFSEVAKILRERSIFANTSQAFGKQPRRKKNVKKLWVYTCLYNFIYT